MSGGTEDDGGSCGGEDESKLWCVLSDDGGRVKLSCLVRRMPLQIPALADLL